MPVGAEKCFNLLLGLQQPNVPTPQTRLILLLPSSVSCAVFPVGKVAKIKWKLRGIFSRFNLNAICAKISWKLLPVHSSQGVLILQIRPILAFHGHQVEVLSSCEKSWQISENFKEQKAKELDKTRITYLIRFRRIIHCGWQDCFINVQTIWVKMTYRRLQPEMFLHNLQKQSRNYFQHNLELTWLGTYHNHLHRNQQVLAL